jgi:hypothetical protein
MPRLAGVGLTGHLPAPHLLEQRAQDPPDRGMVVDLHGLSIGCAGSRMNSEPLGFPS